MARREFEYIKGESRKFWDIVQSGASYTVYYGRIGTTGQSKTTDLASASAARAAVDKLIAEKLAKGYVEMKGGKPLGGPSASPASPPRKPGPRPRASKAERNAAKVNAADTLDHKAGKVPAAKSKPAPASRPPLPKGKPKWRVKNFVVPKLVHQFDGWKALHSDEGGSGEPFGIPLPGLQPIGGSPGIDETSLYWPLDSAPNSQPMVMDSIDGSLDAVIVGGTFEGWLRYLYHCFRRELEVVRRDDGKDGRSTVGNLERRTADLCGGIEMLGIDLNPQPSLYDEIENVERYRLPWHVPYDPDNPTGLVLAGQCVLSWPDGEPHAERFYREALRILPEYTAGHAALARLLAKRSDQEAVRHAVEALCCPMALDATGSFTDFTLDPRASCDDEMIEIVQRFDPPADIAGDPRLHNARQRRGQRDYGKRLAPLVEILIDEGRFRDALLVNWRLAEDHPLEPAWLHDWGHLQAELFDAVGDPTRAAQMRTAAQHVERPRY